VAALFLRAILDMSQHDRFSRPSPHV